MGTAMRSRVVLVGLTGSAADTRVHCGGLSAGWCYTDGIGAPLPSTFIDTFPVESRVHTSPQSSQTDGPDSRVAKR